MILIHHPGQLQRIRGNPPIRYPTDWVVQFFPTENNMEGEGPTEEPFFEQRGVIPEHGFSSSNPMIVLEEPAVLTQGNWWISLYAVMETGSQLSDGVSVYAFVWKNTDETTIGSGR